MKNYFNHKYQAFYLTFICFTPLFLLFIIAPNWLKVELKSESQFTLAIKQFAMQSSSAAPLAQEETKKIKKRVEENHQAKADKKIQKENPNKKTTTQSLQKSEQTQPLQAMQNAQSNPNQAPQTEIISFGQSDNPLLKAIKKAIDNARIYPRQAQRMRMQGEVLLEFLWNTNSTLEEIKIIKSSGHQILDKNAIETIHLASSNFPKHHKNIRLQIPIAYHLR
ncbi:energy transducer TonB [Campylobacter sp. CCS1377]|uniref:Energy transducer TonB n=1 Tax=Campylobacter sp. CCS1377 TaxID=3158229 RepID=A0AAU7E6Y9_9BACT|nr:energy transducer TonB [Campylobacter jejuni]